MIDKETQKPLTTPEQVTMLQDIIVRYNGYGVPDYKNIHGVYIDAGSGGGATQICDLLFDNFYEAKHKGEKDYEHHGLIDANYDYAVPYVKDIQTLLTLFVCVNQLNIRQLCIHSYAR